MAVLRAGIQTHVLSNTQKVALYSTVIYGGMGVERNGK
jgi:hypothetical protein